MFTNSATNCSSESKIKMGKNFPFFFLWSWEKNEFLRDILFVIENLMREDFHFISFLSKNQRALFGLGPII